MSPIEDLSLKDIQALYAEKFRVAALPEFDPTTGKKKPWVVLTRQDNEIKLLLDVINEQRDEILRLETLVEDDEIANLVDEEHPEG